MTPPVASLHPRAAHSGDDRATAWLLGESSHSLNFATTFSEAFTLGASSGAAARIPRGFHGVHHDVIHPTESLRPRGRLRRPTRSDPSSARRRTSRRTKLGPSPGGTASGGSSFCFFPDALPRLFFDLFVLATLRVSPRPCCDDFDRVLGATMTSASGDTLANGWSGGSAGSREVTLTSGGRRGREVHCEGVGGDCGAGRGQGGVREGANLRLHVQLEEVGVQLDDLPVLRRRGSNVDRMDKRRVDVDGRKDFLALRQAEGIREDGVDLDEREVPGAAGGRAAPQAVDAVAGSGKGGLALARHARPAQVHRGVCRGAPGGLPGAGAW